jgi:hypothetical protein
VRGNAGSRAAGLEDFGEDARICGLRCGHGFCEPCLETWMRRAPAATASCPVCRAPVPRGRVVFFPSPPRTFFRARVQVADAEARAPLLGAASGAAAGGAAALGPLDEVRFRLDRLHARYPTLVDRALRRRERCPST